MPDQILAEERARLFGARNARPVALENEGAGIRETMFPKCLCSGPGKPRIELTSEL